MLTKTGFADACMPAGAPQLHSHPSDDSRSQPAKRQRRESSECTSCDVQVQVDYCSCVHILQVSRPTQR